MEDTIKKVLGRQIFDSRGMPTVEATVILESGIAACAAVPSGASTGQYEACELRDGGDEYGGNGVMNAVNNINETISNALEGESVFAQQDIDKTMCELDGTENKSNLGANAILAVSLAVARGASFSADIPLYQYLGGINACTLPVPMMNILNGGAHADNNIDIQEFMIVPTGAESFEQAMQMGTEVYHCLKKLLKDKGYLTSIGDEGGFAPDLENDIAALDFLTEAILKSGYTPGKDIRIALDMATSEWARDNGYIMPKRNTFFSREELIDYIISLIEKYPIISIEDPLGENDFSGFNILAKKTAIQIVGDDLFVTNPVRLQRGIDDDAANTILIKPNQIGTLSETMETIRLAKNNGYRTVISHRSGETADSFIADLAVAVNAGQIKTGAPARSERVSKYNRLLQIELALGRAATYGGVQAFI